MAANICVANSALSKCNRSQLNQAPGVVTTIRGPSLVPNPYDADADD